MLCQSVECALILFDLPSVWDASSQASMGQLKELIVLCSNAAIASAYTATYLSRLRPSQSTAGPDITPGGGASLAAATGEKPQPRTFAELLAALSSTALRHPAGVSVQANMGVAGSIIRTAVSDTTGGGISCIWRQLVEVYCRVHVFGVWHAEVLTGFNFGHITHKYVMPL